MKSHFSCMLPILCVFSLLLTGCSSTRPTGDVAQNLEIQMFRDGEDNQFTLMHVDPDGTLHYAGGQAAIARKTHPVRKLSADERARLWRIIDQHQLYEVPSRGFKKGEHVTYDLTLRGGGINRTLRQTDDHVPGLEILHDTLFKMVHAR